MEDIYAYQIAYSKYSRAAPPLEPEPRESDDDRLKRLYLKTVNAPAPDQNMTELQNLLEALLKSYISGFQVDGRIPYGLRQTFEKDMEKSSKNLSRELSEQYQSALNSGNTPQEALEQAQAVLKEGLETISVKLRRYGKDF